MESENNVINNDIRNPSQLSHLCPFVPVEKLLEQRSKDTHTIKNRYLKEYSATINSTQGFPPSPQILSFNQTESPPETRLSHGSDTRSWSQLELKGLVLYNQHADYFWVSIFFIYKIRKLIK